MVLGTASRGVHGCACLEAVYGDDLLLLPDLERKQGQPAEDGVGAVVEKVKRGDHTAAPDPNEADYINGLLHK
jgi:hypothetical protein